MMREHSVKTLNKSCYGLNENNKYEYSIKKVSESTNLFQQMQSEFEVLAKTGKVPKLKHNNVHTNIIYADLSV